MKLASTVFRGLEGLATHAHFGLRTFALMVLEYLIVSHALMLSILAREPGSLQYSIVEWMPESLVIFAPYFFITYIFSGYSARRVLDQPKIVFRACVANLCFALHSFYIGFESGAIKLAITWLFAAPFLFNLRVLVLSCSRLGRLSEAKFYGQRGKRLLDLQLSIILLLLASPLIVLGAVVVWIQSPTVSPFFKSKRVGQGGEIITILKLRTMVPMAEKVLQTCLSEDEALREEWSKNYKLKNDPRIIPFGNFLRKTSIDELPQFVDVLMGRLSLVGPRPVLEDEPPNYSPQEFSAYIAVKPGITGPWQVSERSNSGWEERARYAAEYEQDISLRKDLLLILATALALFRFDSAR